MINIGIVGDKGRAGSLRFCVNKTKDAHIYGYFNYGDRDINLENEKGYKYYETYEDMLNDKNIDAIILSNYYCSHAKMAIQALNANKHVLSEIATAVTPKECVELVEAVEKSKKVYTLLEPYNYLSSCIYMKNKVESGIFGRIVYAEGEYCHPMNDKEVKSHIFNFDEEHWRLYRPCTFYAEHAIGPLMYMLDVTPTSVFAMAAKGSKEFAEERGYYYTELAGPMLINTDKGIILKATGCTHYAGRGRNYRINGEYGGIEIPRGDGNKIREFYTVEHIPEGGKFNTTYPAPDYDTTLVDKILLEGIHHGGGDFIAIQNFINAILGKERLYFDVYQATALSATQIYAWRSILDNEVKKIPNFKNPQDRDLIRNDDLSPFWINGKSPTLPCTK